MHILKSLHDFVWSKVITGKCEFLLEQPEDQKCCVADHEMGNDSWLAVVVNRP